jgi:hypothetical protein
MADDAVEEGRTCRFSARPLPLARPPSRRRITRRDFGDAQRHQMAPLVRVATDLRALAAAHVAFQFMDRRCLRSPHDVEGHGLMRVAAKVFHFEISKPGVDRVAQRGRMAAPVPENRACACSTPRRRAGRQPCVLPSRALPRSAMQPVPNMAALRLSP